MISLKPYQIKQGDTVHSIAQKVIGDIDSWPLIASINKLKHPYILDEGPFPEGVKTIGDNILVPVSFEDQDAVLDNTDPFSVEEKLFGTDLFISTNTEALHQNQGGELGSNLYKDLQTTSGLQNLKQALINRLITAPGELTRHPKYGSNLLSYIGKKSSSDWEQKSKVEVERTILCDPRVKQVRNLSLISHMGAIHISCSIVTINDYILNFEHSVGASGGE